jgi:hypothetical protein
MLFLDDSMVLGVEVSGYENLGKQLSACEIGTECIIANCDVT